MNRFDFHTYQERALRWILDHPSCALWVEMGLGKTAITLAALRDMLDACEAKRVLVIAPLRVVQHTWPDEIRKWDFSHDLTYTILHGPKRHALLDNKTDIHLINRENTVWLWEQFSEDWPYDTIVVDESSSFKSHSSKRFKALFKASRYAERVIELTGTPATNGLMDLWSQIALLDRGERLGKNITTFRNRYFNSDWMGYTYTPRDNAQKDIERKLSDIVLTMRAEDYLDVPPVIENDVIVSLPPEAREQYDALEKDFLLKLEDETITAATAAALSNKLLQFANGAVYTDAGGHEFEVVHDEKIEALKEIIDGTDDNILCGYTYRSDQSRIVMGFREAARIEHKSAVRDWNDGEIRLLVAHPASAGHGLNLQRGGHTLVWFGLPWSLELYSQMNARLHRQGQEHPVIIHRIIAENTVDETVVRALRAKMSTQDALLDALKEDIKRRQT